MCKLCKDVTLETLDTSILRGIIRKGDFVDGGVGAEGAVMKTDANSDLVGGLGDGAEADEGGL